MVVLKQRNYGGWVVFVCLSAAVLLRLCVWKYFPHTQTFVKEDLSNLIVAALIAAVAVVFYAVKAFQKERPRASGFDLPFLLLLGSAAVSFAYTEDFPSTTKAFLILSSYVFFFYMLADILRDRAKMKAFLFFLLACAFLTSFFGVKEFIFLCHRPDTPADKLLLNTNDSLYYVLMKRRVTSFIGWPNSLAGFLILFLPFSFLSIFTVRRMWAKGVLGVVFLVNLACFVFTFSFLGWLSFTAATLLMLPVFIRRFFANGLKPWHKAAVIAGVVVFIGLFLWVIARKNFADALRPRIIYHQNSCQLIAEKPFLGHGLGTFGIVGRKLVFSREGLTAYAHDSYLQNWAETGLAGFLGLLLLVFFFARRAGREISKRAQTGEGLILLAVVWGLTAFFIDNLFSFTIIKPSSSLYGWALLGVFAALTGKDDSTGQEAALARWPGGVVFIAALLVFYFLARATLGFLDLHQALQVRQAGRTTDAAEFLDRAMALAPWESKFAMARGAVDLDYFRATRDPAYLKRSIEHSEEAIRRSPLTYESRFAIARFYQAAGERARAADAFRHAQEISPFEYSRDVLGIYGIRPSDLTQ